MGHYLLNFVFATIGVVAFMYLAFLYIKKNPHLGGMASPQGNLKGPGLKIESVLNLEPRKRLYVVRYGEQRFMIATTMDKTEFLTTLQAEAGNQAEEESPSTSASIQGTTPPIEPGASFMDRFRYSLKLVLVDRFSGLGGK